MALERDLDSLNELDDAGQRIRIMDVAVAQIERDPTVNFALRIDRHLPRYAECLMFAVLHADAVYSVSIMACLVDTATTEVRAAAYRLLRHLVVDANDAAQLKRHHLEYFLVKYVGQRPSVCRTCAHPPRFAGRWPETPVSSSRSSMPCDSYAA